MTCRRARVRCDEKHPTCERCDRLALACLYQPFISRREKERHHREARERTKPMQIAPNTAGILPLQAPVIPSELIHAVNEDFPDLWTMHDWSSGTEHGFVLPEGSFNFDVFGDPGLDDGNINPISYCAPLQPLNAIDCVARDDVVFQDNYYTQGYVTLHFPSLRRSKPLNLSPSEKLAVEHYRKSLSLKFTTKHPTWSTQQIYICLGAQDPLIMHLLLAISFRDLFFQDNENNELHDLAQKHFRAGIGRLLTAISEEDSPHHLSIMAAFWFLYMLGSSRIHAGIGTMMLLSRVVCDYVQKHVAGLLDIDPLKRSDTNPELSFHVRDQSLLARVTIWMFYADVGFCFCYRGGDLASYLCADTRNISKIVDMGRSVLALNWDQEYPADQAADDDQNLEVLDLLWKSAVMCQAVNDLDQNPPSEELEQQFCELEQTYSAIFQLAEIDLETRPRFLVNADWILSYFYAIRIYHFRYAVQDKDRNARPKVVKRALKSLLNIAQRIFAKGDDEHYERLHWPLFMAGIETSDPIHREWILERLSSGRFRTVMEKVLKIQHLSGIRANMSLIREMCSKEGDAPRVTFLGF